MHPGGGGGGVPGGGGTGVKPGKLAGIHREKPLALRSFLLGGHGTTGHRNKDHIYESPKFERCPGCPHATLPRDPRDPAFFHLARISHHHPQTTTTLEPQDNNSNNKQQQPGVCEQGHISPSHVVPTHVTTPPPSAHAQQQKSDDITLMTSDESEDDMDRCEIRFNKGVGYRPVPPQEAKVQP